VVAVIALIILLLWLNFFLAQEIESLGRDITTQSAELDKIDRLNQSLIGEIALAESQANRAEQAKIVGFVPQQPLYLITNRPVVQQADPRRDTAFLSLWDIAPRVQFTSTVPQNLANLP